MRPLLPVLLLLISAKALAYEGVPAEQVKSFFKDLPVNTDKAIDNLYASNAAISQKVQALTMMKSQMPQVSALYGEFLGYEVISTEKISPSLVRISVLEKRNLHAITWEFYFYKPRAKWMISQAMFFDQFQNVGTKQ